MAGGQNLAAARCYPGLRARPPPDRLAACSHEPARRRIFPAHPILVEIRDRARALALHVAVCEKEYLHIPARSDYDAGVISVPAAAPATVACIGEHRLIITIVVIAWAAIAILLLMFIKRATDIFLND